MGNKGRRRLRKVLLGVADVCVVTLATLTSFWLVNWGKSQTLDCPSILFYWLMGNVVLALGIFSLCKLYSMVLSSVGLLEALKIAFAVGVIGVVNVVFAAVYSRPFGIGYGTTIVYTAFLFFGTMALRFSKRGVLTLKHIYNAEKKTKKRVMVVGCGEAGLTLQIGKSTRLNSSHA